MKLFRCSSLSKLMGKPQNKSEVLSDTAKSSIAEMVIEDHYGFRFFKGNQYTQKGNMLEDQAIDLSGKIRFRKYQKHIGRVENGLITGECDVLDQGRKLIIDTKCSWNSSTHPWFQHRALKKVKEAGYDWQMQGYMDLYNCEKAFVDFWLFPCPAELLNDWDDIDQLVHMVEAIPLNERLTTVVIDRDESMIEQIKQKIPLCQEYYAELVEELKVK